MRKKNIIATLVIVILLVVLLVGFLKPQLGIRLPGQKDSEMARLEEMFLPEEDGEKAAGREEPEKIEDPDRELTVWFLNPVHVKQIGDSVKNPLAQTEIKIEEIEVLDRVEDYPSFFYDEDFVNLNLVDESGRIQNDYPFVVKIKEEDGGWTEETITPELCAIRVKYEVVNTADGITNFAASDLHPYLMQEYEGRITALNSEAPQRRCEEGMVNIYMFEVPFYFSGRVQTGKATNIYELQAGEVIEFENYYLADRELLSQLYIRCNGFSAYQYHMVDGYVKVSE